MGVRVKRNARLLVGVSLVAGFGSTAMSLTAAVWVMALTGSSGLAALAGFFVYAPVLAGPALGAVVDRLPARRVLVATNLTMAGLLLTLFAVHSGRHVWLVYVVMLSYGFSYVLVDAAEARLVTAAFPREALGGLNGVRMSAQEATKLLAPLAGAGLFTAVGGPAVAAVAAAALVASAGLYTRVRGHTGELLRTRADELVPAHRPLLWEMVAGVRYLLAKPLVRTPVLVASVAMLASGVGTAAIYSVVDQALHRSPAFVGVLASVQGGGAILGGLLVGRLLDRFRETVVAAVGAVTFSLGPLTQAIGTHPSVLAGSALVGIGLPWTVVAALTAVQRHTPHEMVGRVAGTGTTLVFAPPAVGIPLGAFLVTVLDYRIPLVVAAAGCAVVATVALRTTRLMRSTPARAAATSASTRAPATSAPASVETE